MSAMSGATSSPSMSSLLLCFIRNQRVPSINMRIHNKLIIIGEGCKTRYSDF